MSTAIDIIYCQNNGVTAVRPVPGSRLDRLVRRAKGPSGSRELEQMWVFADPTTWSDDCGNLRTDHRERGVVCGKHRDGWNFLDMCREIDLRVEFTGLYVPFSNGQRRHGTFADGVPFADYPEDELRLARFDLPTKETLRGLINDAAVSDHH